MGFRWHDYEMQFGFEDLHYRLVAWRERGVSVPVPRLERWQNVERIDAVLETLYLLQAFVGEVGKPGLSTYSFAEAMPILKAHVMSAAHNCDPDLKADAYLKGREDKRVGTPLGEHGTLKATRLTRRLRPK